MLAGMISASPRRLNVFKAVVERGGFNAAANHLGIAQPSVGAHVKALEGQIGQPLFHRHRGAKPRLTKAGETLYAFAVDLLRKTDEAAHTLADLRAADTREITIAAHRDVAAYILPPRLASFAAHHPKVRIVTRIGTIEDVVEMVNKRDVQLGLFVAAGAVPGLPSEVLALEPLVMVASPRHPLARRRSITPADLDGLSLVTGLRHSRYARLVETALRGIGVAQWDVVMELQESSAVKETVRHGAGVACLPRCTVREEIAAGSLAVLRLAHPLAELELHCAYRGPLSATARQLVTHLGQAAAAARIIRT
jgi:LysR family transcriptional regulator, low CO2-responsive transcriptional regulator